MSDKQIIAHQYIEEGHEQEKVLRYTGIAKSTYYYKRPQDSRAKGRPHSTHTSNVDGSKVKNEQVIEHIKAILNEEFVDYGYIKTTHALRQEYEYIINPKKVYRLMGEHKLLNVATRSKHGKREWVKQLVPKPIEHFSYLEFDIKYMYIKGQRRNALVLTVIDVYSRWVLGQYMSWQIKKGDVIKLFDRIFESYKIPEKIYVRNDNGSQMIAQSVQNYFKKKDVLQEFTKPATPEQNAHIESYHSILERVICTRYEFENLTEAGQTMNRFLKFYNHKRIHSGTEYQSPYNYLKSKGVDIKVETIEIDVLNLSKSNAA